MEGWWLLFGNCWRRGRRGVTRIYAKRGSSQKGSVKSAGVMRTFANDAKQSADHLCFGLTVFCDCFGRRAGLSRPAGD